MPKDARYPLGWKIWAAVNMDLHLVSAKRFNLQLTNLLTSDVELCKRWIDDNLAIYKVLQPRLSSSDLKH